MAPIASLVNEKKRNTPESKSPPEEAQKIEIGGKHYPIRSSIGIAWTKENCKTYSEYFDEADELLYTAKKSGKCRICHKQID